MAALSRWLVRASFWWCHRDGFKETRFNILVVDMLIAVRRFLIRHFSHGEISWLILTNPLFVSRRSGADVWLANGSHVRLMDTFDALAMIPYRIVSLSHDAVYDPDTRTIYGRSR